MVAADLVGVMPTGLIPSRLRQSRCDHTDHAMKSDFSGEYVLDRRASTLSSGAAAVQSAMVRIDHREPVFRYSAKFVADGKTVLEYSFELLTDGAEVPLAENDVSRLSWEGDALVAEHRTGTRNPVVTISWRYELIDTGRRLRAIEQVRGAGRDQENVWEFERQ
jgi:hypothetical protein